ncbi:MAG: peptidoglycan-binding domain-containing protein, partial [Patescibacteria group bacterium]
MSTILPTSGRMTRVIVSLSTALALSGAGAMVPLVASADHTAIHTLEQSITKLMDELNALKAQQGGGAKCSFTRDLFQGVTGADVKCLQQSLNGAGFQVAASGAGSPGNETMFFGSLTRSAVSKWQAANGVSPTAGYFGPRSRAKYDSMVVVTPPPPPPPPPGTPPPVTPPGTGLAVAAGTQPGDSLAPLSAAR